MTRPVHRWTRRWLLAASGGVGLATPLAACGAARSETAPPVPPAAATAVRTHPDVTLEYWGRFQPAAGGGVEDKRVAEFVAANAPTKVVRTTMVGSYIEKLTTALAAGNLPDVYNVGGTDIPSLSAKGAALTIAEYPAVQKELPDFFAPPLEQCKYQGKINGLPYTLGPRAIVFRKDLMASVGLDAARFPDTWDAFRDAAKRLTKWEGSSLLRAGFEVPLGGFSAHDFFITLHEELGEHPFAADLSRPTFAGPVGQQALQFMVDLVNKDLVDGSGKPAPPQGFDPVVAGINAMAWTNTSPIVNAKSAAPDIVAALATAPIPKFKQRSTYLAGQYLMVSSKPKDATEAVSFLLYLTAARFADEISSVESGVSPRKSASSSPYLRDPLIKTMYEAIAYAWTVPNHVYYTEIRDVIAAAVIAAVARTKSVEAALMDAARSAQDLLNKK
jgi:multiple sugar transport system substrate-binding protein